MIKKTVGQIMNGHDLKQLQTRKTKLEAELARLEIERKEAVREYDMTANKLRKIRQEIKNMTREPVISEHALLRYIERVKGANLEEIRKEILTDERKMLIRKIGNGKYPIGEHRIVVRDMVIVSIE